MFRPKRAVGDPCAPEGPGRPTRSGPLSGDQGEVRDPGLGAAWGRGHVLGSARRLVAGAARGPAPRKSQGSRELDFVRRNEGSRRLN